jgi:hypothetical protein
VVVQQHHVLWVAGRIADADLLEVPQVSYDATVFVAIYRGMCAGITKTWQASILFGCPLLQQLWSYERLPIGRPRVD